MRSLVKCERCGNVFREEDLEVDEDTHENLCPNCYHQGF